MSSRARKRHYLMHAHPEHGMTSKIFLDAHVAYGIAQGKYMKERERVVRIADVLTRLIKERQQAEKTVRDYMKKHDSKTFLPEVYANLKKDEEHAITVESEARKESRAASNAIWQARIELCGAEQQLVRLRWWNHVTKRVIL